MKVKKYEDMAYTNPRGMEWINTMYLDDVWSRWCKKVLNHSKATWQEDPNRPEKILCAAIWHWGYAHDNIKSPAVQRTAWRLRHPREEGAGAFKGGFRKLSQNSVMGNLPLEFYLLEEFLENVVRPRLESATKLEG